MQESGRQGPLPTYLRQKTGLTRLTEEGVLWFYPRSRRPDSFQALLSDCREYCALTKAS